MARSQRAAASQAVFIAATLWLLASVVGKLVGVHWAGKALKWAPGESSIIGWLLQTKALIMIIFANILLEYQKSVDRQTPNRVRPPMRATGSLRFSVCSIQVAHHHGREVR